MGLYKFYLDVSHNISHIGSDVRGIGVENVMEWVHSDTLFSAIIHGLVKSGAQNNIEKLFEQFRNYNENQKSMEPPFRLSSAFLAYKKSQEKQNGELQNSWVNANYIEFVPMPLTPPAFDLQLDRLNKQTFISLENALKWIRSPETEFDKAQYIESLNLDGSCYKKRFLNRIRAVNAKDRRLNQTQVYHRGEVVYTDNTWLYFFVEIGDDLFDDFKKALIYLQEAAGIGGEINVGFSEFKDIDYTKVELSEDNSYQNFYLLSLLSLIDDIAYDKSYYDIINKKSWFHSPFHNIQLKKKTVKMIKEGSCIRCDRLNGKLVDVTPNEWEKRRGIPNWHSIYRNGIGFGIGY